MKQVIYLLCLFLFSTTIYSQSKVKNIRSSIILGRTDPINGLYNLKGKQIFAPKYYKFTPLDNGKLKVSRLGKSGVADLDGIFGLDIKYEDIEFDKSIYKVTNYNIECAIIDSSFNELLSIKLIGEGDIHIYDDGFLTFNHSKHSGRPLLRFYDRKANLLKSDSSFRISQKYKDNMVVREDVGNAIMNYKLEILLPLMKDTIPCDLVNDSTLLVNYKGKYGFMKTDGREITPFEFTRPQLYSKDMDYYQVYKGGKQGVICASTGKYIVPCEYYTIVTRAQKGEKGYWATQANTHTDPWVMAEGTDSISITDVAKLGYKHHSLQYNRPHRLVNENYDHLTFIAPNLLLALKDRKYGLLDTLHQVLLPVEYNYVYTYEYNETRNLKFRTEDKNFIFTHDRKLISLDSITQATEKYTEVFKFIEDYAIVKQGYRYGVTNMKGDSIIPPKFRLIKATKQPDEFEVCDTNNKWFLYKCTSLGSHMIEKIEATETGSRYRRKEESVSDNLAVYSYRFPDGNYLYDLANDKGKRITNNKYEFMKFVANVGRSYYFEIKDVNDLKGIINEKGKVIVPVKYREIKLVELAGKKYFRVSLPLPILDMK